MIQRRFHSQSGATLIELMVASTLFVGVSTLVFSGGMTSTLTQLDQTSRTIASTQANVARARILGDAVDATAVECADAETLALDLGSGPATPIEYYALDGNLMRWTQPTDKESMVASGVSTLACTSYGTDGVLVDLALGTTEHPFNIYVRISDSGAIP